MKNLNHLAEWLQGKSLIQVFFNSDTRLYEIYRDGNFCQSQEDQPIYG